jgi:hypothetical protein
LHVRAACSVCLVLWLVGASGQFEGWPASIVAAITAAHGRLRAGLWVYEDAKSRDWSTERFANKAWKWGLAAFLVWIVFTPLYLIRRRRHPVVA